MIVLVLKIIYNKNSKLLFSKDSWLKGQISSTLETIN